MPENEPKAQKSAAPAAKVRLATVYPHVFFDPGDGLAPVVAEGTEYSREDANKVLDRAEVLSIKQGYPLQITEVE